MDSLINAAGRALATGDPLGALNRVALRDDPPALAMRGIAMAQLGDLPRAKELLRQAARAFGPGEPLARARCRVAMAEIALVLRDIGEPMRGLEADRLALTAHGDHRNAAHAGYLEARRLLLIGRLDTAEAMLEDIDIDALPPTSRPGHWLVVAGIAMRRIRAEAAEQALVAARRAAREAALPALMTEVDRAMLAFAAPAARLRTKGDDRLLGLGDVEALIAFGALIVDACRNQLRQRATIVPLGNRPVLFALARTLAEAWPDDVTREALLLCAFRAREADDSHRARLRVEIGRLRAEIEGLAEIHATERGFILAPSANASIAVLLPPREEAHADILALLADGEAWSSSALAQALDVSPRTVQRGLDVLAAAGKVDSLGRGRACRWMARQLPGFPTILLLPAALAVG